MIFPGRVKAGKKRFESLGSILICRLLYLSLIFVLQACAQERHHINGISFVATRSVIQADKTAPVKEDYHANYAAVIPYGFMRSLDSPKIIYNTPRQWWGEQLKGARATIELFQQQGTNVMLKPQIWIGGGDYTGNISMLGEKQWKELEDSYTTFIMEFAQLAADVNIPLFCIGTELDSFVQEQPEYWSELIVKIREIYKGKITYAGNWDSYKDVKFWSELDYIGVDAYFPVSERRTPDLNDVKASWGKWKMEMSTLSRKHNRKILFTEYGYVSADYAGREPWKNAGEDRPVNFQAQQVLLDGLYQSVWNEDWMAGGFLWKHHAESYRREGWLTKLFTTQDKPAQEIVAAQYLKSS